DPDVVDIAHGVNLHGRCADRLGQLLVVHVHEPGGDVPGGVDADVDDQSGDGEPGHRVCDPEAERDPDQSGQGSRGGDGIEPGMAGVPEPGGAPDPPATA